ncbi:Hypothetical protein (Fragment), partial [Durusdinium trenchii]
PEALRELQRLGFRKKWLPSHPFHKLFPKGSQVNKYESTAAWVYTQGSVFAYEMNRLMQNCDWASLFAQYGYAVKALFSYCEKMQDAYGERQKLYRGYPGSLHEAQNEYHVGRTFAWPSFTSTSKCRATACDFAKGEYSSEGGFPILFEISTLSRGAPLLGWSRYPTEDEVLLLPFQGFHVTDIFFTDDRRMLVIQLSTVKLGHPTSGPTSYIQNQVQLSARLEEPIVQRPSPGDDFLIFLARCSY